AGVSALGFGGTNAHIILEEAPEPADPPPARPWQLLTLSAKTPAALEQATRNLAEHLRAYPDANLADVAYTLQVGRRAFDHRRVVVARDRDEALALLEANDLRRILSASQNTLDRRIAFMFPGQGAQYAGMARDLYGHEAVFREAVDRCADLLQPLLGLDIRPLIFDEAERESTKDTKGTNGSGYDNAKRKTQNAKLTETQFAQPALFAVEYALAQLWQSWGVVPSALIGHSIGEYVAATLAGVFRLEDALALVAARGRLMQALPAGAMLSVQLPEGELLPLLREGLSLAAVNGPRACVAAGPEHAVAALEGQLAARDISYRRLHTSHAFHSAMMDPLVETFAAEVARTERQAPQLPFVSNRTGTWITAEQATDPRYWAEHLRHAVRFADGLATLLADSDRVLLEVGPGRTLSALAKQARDPQDSRPIIASLRHPQDSTPDPASMLSALGQLWLAGQTIDWRRLHSGARRRVPLPTYPFERQRFWLDSQAALPGTALPAATRQGDPVRKQADLTNWFSLPVWQRAAAPRPPRPDELAAQPRRWLIFADQTGLARALAQRLEQADHQVVTAVPGADFAQIDNRLYALDPRQPEHYQTLLEQLDGPPEQIVHLWSVGAGAIASDAAGFEAEQERGFYSLLFLAQALGRMDSPPARIALVTSQAHSITPDEPLHPARATLHGLGRVIPQELPQFSCRSIDVGLPQSNQALQRLGDLLLGELLAEGEELGVVYRGQQRWVQRFEPLPLEEEPPSAPALRPGGVYLLTGGLAEIGLALSGYLARTLRARLILVESSDFPPRDAWEEWLERRPAGDAASRKIRHIAELERQGAEVLVLGGDPADPDQLRAAIAQARARFGVLHGVIHAAAVTGERAFRGIQETDRAECGWHFVPKAHGLYALEQALGDEPIDFCALVSSLAAFLGGRGYAAYAAANLFMDAFAQGHNRSGGAPWVSINWDAWQLEDGKMTAMSQDLALLAMTPNEGGAALRRILAAGGLDQVVVSTADLPARIAQWQERLRAMRGVASGEPAGPPATLHPRPNLPTPFVPPENDLERTIATVWQQALGFEQVGINDNFFDLGADSLIAIRVVAQLKQALGAELSVVSLYETLTIKALAESLAQNGQNDQLGDRESREAKISRRKHYRQQKRSER
ncbi:MAG TPA: acyltransferase domain-containing protein, partial [Roseiflexaceae bacterium]|nr:acyltransferase domain-containing protein [Roseiflexaceae bacterium]